MITFPLSDNLLTRPQVNVLIQISQACSHADDGFLLIGAFARDLILKVVHDLDPPRATTDIDFAICTSDWESYERTIESLENDHGFSRTRSIHRYTSPENVIVDLIPFGGIEAPIGEVSFPPKGDEVLSTIGFTEAYQGALTFSLEEDGPSFRVASLPGICLLKLRSWSDQPYQREKDVDDIAYFIRNYFDLVDSEELYSRHGDQMQRDDFDQTLVGARILGRHVGLLLQDTDVSLTINSILDKIIAAGIEGHFTGLMTPRIPNIDVRYQSIIELRSGLADATQE